MITLEVVDDAILNVVADWPPGCDTEVFANMLVSLCRGELVAPILGAVTMCADRLGEGDKGEAIRELFEIATNPASDDEPIICPTQAVKANTRAFPG